MHTPTATDLAIRPGLVPLHDLTERLAEAIAAVAKHQRNATVTLTYKVAWDSDTQRLYVGVASKSKRPVKTNRNEEVIGEDENILTLKQDHPGQQWVPGTEPEGDVVKLDRLLKDHDATMTVEGPDGRKATIGGKGKAKA